MFYSTYLPPGSYQLSHFGGSGFFAGQYRYNVGQQGNETSVRIKKPGIYYIGSYKYKKVKTGFFSQDQFSIQKVKSPSEADLLKRILDADSDVKNSVWNNRIRARLGQLKK